MVEVFKTNITKNKNAKRLLARLIEVFPACKMTFDLEDCDRIFRIESIVNTIDIELVKTFFEQNGFVCEVLNDD
ncbi:MAG: hypothetical protein JNL70_13215 [Saprospiraceae bacterium]|nr:hypothetical protein [Saprospiraceae bacterium]